MEIESSYSAEDKRTLETLKTPGLQESIDKHCLAISSANSLDDLRKIHLPAAYEWLNSVVFAPNDFSNDYIKIRAIFYRLSGKRMVELLSQKKSPEDNI